LPEGLSLDTWQGEAWVGLVLFHMSGVRPRFFPPVPGISTFHETNVRTYVRYPDREPGVWFFSLDAASRLAVRIARWRWGLNYHLARMQIQRKAGHVRYSSTRQAADGEGPSARVEASLGGLIGDEVPQRELPAGYALPGTLEHFLLERYVLYTSRAGRLLKARVHHPPYAIREARVLTVEQSLVESNRIHPTGPVRHAAFCETVDVEIFGLVGAEAPAW
jgi:uncharacterized protein YqjF (DUF2071 family)